MGYESRLYIVEKNEYTAPSGAPFRCDRVLAVVDMGKCYLASDKLRSYPATECEIYDVDGNTPLTEDCYGDPLKEIPLAEAIRIIERAEALEHYRRYTMVLGILHSMSPDDWGNNVVVLHYGY